MADVIEIKVPDLGTEDAQVIEILVAVGDQVEEDQGLVTVETDKATMDIPAPQAGVIAAIHLKVGDKVNEGDAMASFEVAGADAPAAAPIAETPAVESKEETKEEAPAPVAETPAASVATTTQVIDIKVPDLGVDEAVPVIEVFVKEGDRIEKEASLVTVETDKASIDVPSSEAGVVKKLHVKVGDSINTGSLLIELETESAAPAPAAVAPSAPTPVAETAAPAVSTPSAPAPVSEPVVASGNAHATPAVRRLAREFGVDLGQVQGTGQKARITKEDVQNFVKSRLAAGPAASAGAATGGGLQVIAQPKVDFSKFGEIEEVELTRIQKISGPNLHRNWVTIPHVTQFDEADITELENFRKSENAALAKQKSDVKFTPLVFVLKAVAKALQEFPVFNSSLSTDGQSLIMKKYIHIGIAVDTPNGLVVPVVRDVDQKGIVQLSRELAEISVKAREGKLKLTDMQGGCFSISSLGGIGGTAFTPIVNAPEVAILGVSRNEMKPVWNGKEFEPRLMLPLSLSYDHRVIDGALAARFTVYLSQVLGDLRKIIL